MASEITEQAKDMRRISICWHGGWHACAAGPCFDTHEQAIAHRNDVENEDKPWITH